MSKKLAILSTAAAAALSIALMSAPAAAADTIIGLITKTNTNPFFVKMKEGAEKKAKELGVTLQAYAGKADGDNDGEVAAIEALINAGAKGFMLVPSDSTAIVHAESRGLELAIGLALPATLGLIVLGEPIVRMLFQHGAFTAQDSAATAQALTFLALL